MGKFRELKVLTAAVLLLAFVFVGIAPTAAENLRLARRIEAETVATGENEPTEPTTEASEITEPGASETEPAPTEAEPTEAEPTEAEPTEAEPTEAEPTVSEPAETEPAETEPEPSETADPQDKYTLKIDVKGMGGVWHSYGAGGGTFEVKPGAEPELTVKPARNYRLESLKVNQIERFGDLEELAEGKFRLVLEPVSEDLYVFVTFAEIPYDEQNDPQLETEDYVFSYSEEPLRIFSQTKAGETGTKEKYVVMKPGSEVYVKPKGDYGFVTLIGENIPHPHTPQKVKTLTDDCYIETLRLGRGLLGYRNPKNISANIGIVFDDLLPTVSLTGEQTQNPGYYHKDFTVNVKAEDPGKASGLKAVTYQIMVLDAFGEAKQTQSGTLHRHKSDDESDAPVSVDGKINVSALLSSGVGTIFVKAVDMADNEFTAKFEFSLNTSTSPVSATDVTKPAANAAKGYYNEPFAVDITFEEDRDRFSWRNAFDAITVTRTGGDGSELPFDVANSVTDYYSSGNRHTLRLVFKEDGKYSWNVNYVNFHGVASEPLTAGPKLHLELTVDQTPPTGKIGFDETFWENFINRLIYREWLNTGITILATGQDALSPLRPVKYLVLDNPNGAPSYRELERRYADGEFSEEQPVLAAEMKRFVAVARLEDYAGNVGYVTTDGIIIDTFAPTVKIETLTRPNQNGFYNKNIKYNIHFDDRPDGIYSSGIEQITMEIFDNGKRTVSKVLFVDQTANNENPDYVTRETFRGIAISAQKHNVDNVELRVTVRDRAGNVGTASEFYMINVDRPQVEIAIDGEPVSVNDVGRGYFNQARTATIKVRDRANAFDAEAATEAIVIKAGNAIGSPVELDRSAMIGEWKSTENVHETTVTFDQDANYTFTFEYTNSAGNVCQPVVTEGSNPERFTIDRANPSGVLRMNDYESSRLITEPGLRLISNEPIAVTVESQDRISPVTVDYYKDDGDKPLSEAELAEAPFKPFEAFTLTEDEQFALYLRVSDAAGNTVYLSSGSSILDSRKPVIERKSTAPNKGKVYNKDTDLTIRVSDAAPSSGLETVAYRIEVDGNVTQSATLFSRDAEANKLEDRIDALEETIRIEAGKNNSNHVVVYVTATDRAGNRAEERFDYAFDVTPPQVFLNYDNNDDGFNSGYFMKPRTATLTVVERGENFDADRTAKNINIIATDAKGNVIPLATEEMIGEWRTTEGKTPDEDRHEITITFDRDARYRVSARVTDKAGNRNAGIDTGENAAPFEFTVDTTAPKAVVTFKTREGTERKRDTLIPRLTFDLWSGKGISIRAAASDVTSDIHSIKYHISTADNALSEKQLKQLNTWQTYKPFELSENGQFTVYFKVTDKAGNVTYISTDGMMIDSIAPRTERLAPVVTTNPKQPINGLYRGDVSVDVKVVDPVVSNSASGLKTVRYRVIADGKTTQEDVLYAFPKAEVEKKDLQYVYTGQIRVKSALNNSNDVRVEVIATDHANNTSTEEVALKIDTTAPTIHVRYDNNAVDSGKYFNAERVAMIRITERNFDPADVRVAITNSAGSVPQVSGWTSSGSGDQTVHSATIRFAADGDYTFDINYTDRAGNPAKGVTFADGTVNAKSFSIDRTKPEVSVRYDNNDAANGKYFKEPRTATVTIRERNFDPQRVRIQRSGKLENRALALGDIAWSHNGDSHTATLKYDRDGDYTFDIAVTDAAGNEAAGIDFGNAVAERAFTIDTTIDPPVITGVEDGKSYTGAVVPALSFGDLNFDRVEYRLLRTRLGDKNTDVTQELMADMALTAAGGEGVFDNFAEVPENDGIYELSVKVIDKAGNTSEDSLRFTLNRFGSVYVYDDYLIGLKETYRREIDKDFVITEYNADRLVADSVNILITRDGEPLDDIDYEIISRDNAPGASGWYEYEYRIAKSNFEKDGVYRVSVASRDEAGNTPDSLASAEGEILFRVDRTAPEITSVKGLEDAIVNATEQAVEFDVFDAMGLKRVTVYVDGDVVADYEDPEDLINFTGSFKLDEGSNQHVRVVAEDIAGNVTDTDTADDGGNYRFAPDFDFNRTVTVSTNFFIRWYANRPLFIGSVAGLSIILLGLIGAFAAKSKKEKA